MNPPRFTAGFRPRRARRPRVVATVAAVATAAMLAVSCARFPDAAPSFSAQPSLTPNVATLVAPSSASSTGDTPAPPSTSSGTPSSATPSSAATDPPEDPSSPPPSSSRSTTDPCAPSMPPVVASCLTDPWGLAPLPDGQSALVGERTTGKILLVAPGKKPEPVATVTDMDSAGGGGLLGIALSPYYQQDNLIYVYVTTATDGRILRIAPGQEPKAIFTGIPRGAQHNGGPIAFGADGMLYVATGDAGDAKTAAAASSLAGKVLRLDAFGKPAAGNKGGSAVYAQGLSDPTGICPLTGGKVGVVDHRATTDLLIPVRAGADYTRPASGDTLWTYLAGDGGGVDCAVSKGFLMATSLDAKKVTNLQMTPAGGFTGSPQDVATGTFGRLRTIVAGPGDLVWLTTANKDGHGKPIASDDRVIVLPSGGGGGGGGGND